MIILDNLPLPPSSNMCYPTFNGRRVRSKALRDFEKEMLLWRDSNWEVVERTKLETVSWMRKGFQLCVDCYFIFDHSRLWTLKNEVKTLDASNFVKPMHDAIAAMIGIDDKHFFSGVAEKISTERSRECAIVVISQMKPRTEISIREHLMDTVVGALRP